MNWLPLLGSVAAFGFIRWRKPRACRAWLLASASVALLLFAIQYCLVAQPDAQWAMPFWLQLAYPTIHWSLVLGSVGVISGLVLVHGPRTGAICKIGVPCIALLLLAGFTVPAWQNLRPDPPPLREPRQSSDGVILQSSAVTCAPAAAANIATSLGRPMTEGELVERFGTKPDGTTPAQVAYGMGRLGFQWRKRTVPDHRIQALTPPAILFVSYDTHAVAFVGMTNGGLAEILDPLGGRKLWRPELLAEIWAGHAIEFRRATP